MRRGYCDKEDQKLVQTQERRDFSLEEGPKPMKQRELREVVLKESVTGGRTNLCDKLNWISTMYSPTCKLEAAFQMPF